jgi:uncharacterized protein (DUF169 family)
MIDTMVELKYLKSEEVPAIPRQQAPWQAVVYAPLPDATFTPDVVVFRGNARQIMTLSEAARAAGVLDAATLGGRPACSMIPQTMTSGMTMASIGCIGNRVYTELGDDELYLSVPGAAIDKVMEQVGVIINANRELEAFHRQRDAALRQ